MEIFGIGPMELILVLIIALMVFGPDKLPEIGAKLGKAMRSMREATHEFSQEIEEARQALEAPVQDIAAPFKEATAAVQAISHPQEALREALLGEVNRADDAARQPTAEQEQAAVATTDGVLAGEAAVMLEGSEPVTENPGEDGASEADQPAAENPQVVEAPLDGGDVSAETALLATEAEAPPSVDGRAEVPEALAAPAADVAPTTVPASEAVVALGANQPAPADSTAFDMEEFVAVMQSVSRRLSSGEGQISEPPTAEPAAPAPISDAPEPEGPQSAANPAVEE